MSKKHLWNDSDKVKSKVLTEIYAPVTHHPIWTGLGSNPHTTNNVNIDRLRTKVVSEAPTLTVYPTENYSLPTRFDFLSEFRYK